MTSPGVESLLQRLAQPINVPKETYAAMYTMACWRSDSVSDAAQVLLIFIIPQHARSSGNEQRKFLPGLSAVVLFIADLFQLFTPSVGHADDSEIGHLRVRRGAVPVFDARVTSEHIARIEFLDGAYPTPASEPLREPTTRRCTKG
jgi:hypothetical protein